LLLLVEAVAQAVNLAQAVLAVAVVLDIKQQLQ
jgi:hypothetical protein